MFGQAGPLIGPVDIASHGPKAHPNLMQSGMDASQANPKQAKLISIHKLMHLLGLYSFPPLILWMSFPRIKIKLLDHWYFFISLFFWMIFPLWNNLLLEKMKNKLTRNLGNFLLQMFLHARGRVVMVGAMKFRRSWSSNCLLNLLYYLCHFTNLRKGAYNPLFCRLIHLIYNWWNAQSISEFLEFSSFAYLLGCSIPGFCIIFNKKI